MASYATPEEEWGAFLSGTHPHLQDKSPLRFIPSNPRCKLCSAPFGRPGAFVLRRYGYSPWEKNPRICGRCFKNIGAAAKMCPTSRRRPRRQRCRGGAHDAVRRCPRLEQAGSTDADAGVHAPHEPLLLVSKDVLVEADAIIEKFVGDAVVALFVPFMTGPDTPGGGSTRPRPCCSRRVTATASRGCPWGAGVHTGIAFVGIVGRSPRATSPRSATRSTSRRTSRRRRPPARSS